MKMTMTNETEETLGGIEVMDNHDYEIEFDPEAATVAEAEAERHAFGTKFAPKFFWIMLAALLVTTFACLGTASVGIVAHNQAAISNANSSSKAGKSNSSSKAGKSKCSKSRLRYAGFQDPDFEEDELAEGRFGSGGTSKASKIGGGYYDYYYYYYYGGYYDYDYDYYYGGYYDYDCDE